MDIDNGLIEYLADLSRLELAPDEKEARKHDLAEILNYMEKLNELDTTGLPEVTHPFGGGNRFREDEGAGGGAMGSDEGYGAGTASGDERDDAVVTRGSDEGYGAGTTGSAAADNSAGTALSNAPDSKGPYFRVPRAVEE